MTKEIIEQDGVITEKMSDVQFRVQLTVNQKIVMAYTSGKMQQKYIRIYQGDKVRVEMSPFSLNQARIVYRYKKETS